MSNMGFEPFRDFDSPTSWPAAGGCRTGWLWTPGAAAAPTRWRSTGVDPERIELICERNGLTIRAERAADYGEQDEVLIAGRLQPARRPGRR